MSKVSQVHAMDFIQRDILCIGCAVNVTVNNFACMTFFTFTSLAVLSNESKNSYYMQT